MAARDVYKGLSGRIQKRKEREELHTVGAKFLGNFIREYGKGYEEQAYLFANENEEILQQRLNIEDAAENASFFIGRRNEETQGLKTVDDYLIAQATEARRQEITNQLQDFGYNASHFYVDRWAREDAEEGLADLRVLFDDAHDHARSKSSSWDTIKVEDFIKLNDGIPDNPGSAMYKAMKGVFGEQEPEVTQAMLADRLENSEYGKGSAAMNALTAAYSEGLGLSNALNLADGVALAYKKPITYKSLDYTHTVDIPGAPPSRLVEYTDLNGIEIERVEFGRMINGEWVQNENDLVFQRRYYDNLIPTMHLVEYTQNGVEMQVSVPVLVDQENRRVVYSGMGSQTPVPFGSAGDPNVVIPSQFNFENFAAGATDIQVDAMRNTMSSAMRSSVLHNPDIENFEEQDLGTVWDLALGVRAMQADANLATLDDRRTPVYRKVIGTASILSLSGFPITNANKIAAIMTAEDMRSGLITDEGWNTFGTNVYLDQYNFVNKPFNVDQRFNSIDLINAYAVGEAGEASSRIELNSENINYIRFGTINTNIDNMEGEERAQAQATIENNYASTNTFIRPLEYSIADPANQEKLRYMASRYSVDPKYKEAIDSLLIRMGYTDENKPDPNALFRTHNPEVTGQPPTIDPVAGAVIDDNIRNLMGTTTNTGAAATSLNDLLRLVNGMDRDSPEWEEANNYINNIIMTRREGQREAIANFFIEGNARVLGYLHEQITKEHRVEPEEDIWNRIKDDLPK